MTFFGEHNLPTPKNMVLHIRIENNNIKNYLMYPLIYTTSDIGSIYLSYSLIQGCLHVNTYLIKQENVN